MRFHRFEYLSHDALSCNQQDQSQTEPPRGIGYKQKITNVSVYCLTQNIGTLEIFFEITCKEQLLSINRNNKSPRNEYTARQDQILDVGSIVNARHLAEAKAGSVKKNNAPFKHIRKSNNDPHYTKRRRRHLKQLSMCRAAKETILKFDKTRL